MKTLEHFDNLFFDKFDFPSSPKIVQGPYLKTKFGPQANDVFRHFLEMWTKKFAAFFGALKVSGPPSKLVIWRQKRLYKNFEVVQRKKDVIKLYHRGILW